MWRSVAVVHALATSTFYLGTRVAGPDHPAVRSPGRASRPVSVKARSGGRAATDRALATSLPEKGKTSGNRPASPELLAGPGGGSPRAFADANRCHPAGVTFLDHCEHLPNLENWHTALTCRRVTPWQGRRLMRDGAGCCSPRRSGRAEARARPGDCEADHWLDEKETISAARVPEETTAR